MVAARSVKLLSKNPPQTFSWHSMGNYTCFDSRFSGGLKEIYGIKGKKAEAVFPFMEGTWYVWKEKRIYLMNGFSVE